MAEEQVYVDEAYDKIDVSEVSLIEDQPANETHKSESEQVADQTTMSEGDVESDTDSSAKKEDYLFTDEDGKGFTMDDVLEWKKDNQNKTDWQTSNTQKAQELSGMKGAVDSIGQLATIMKSDRELAESIKEAIDESSDGKGGKLFEALMSGDLKAIKSEDPNLDKVANLTSEVEDLKGVITFMEAKDDLKKQYKLSNKRMDEIVDYAVKESDIENGRFITLEDAMKLTEYDSLKEKAKYRKPKTPNTANKTHGAKDIAKRQSGPMSYEGIDHSGYDLLN